MSVRCWLTSAAVLVSVGCSDGPANSTDTTAEASGSTTGGESSETTEFGTGTTEVIEPASTGGPSSGGSTTTGETDETTGEETRDVVITRIVSVPDFINMDLQYRDPRLFDLSSDAQATLVEEIDAAGPQALINPNVANFIGTTENGYRGASQVLLEALGAEAADCFVVAGDLLYTRWPKRSNLGERTNEQFIREQADIYYDGWVQNVREFAGYDIARQQVFAAVGDHEVGDNSWPAELRELFPVFREIFTDKVGGPVTQDDGAYVSAPQGLEGRTYAVQKGNVLILAVDQLAEITTTTGPLDVVGTQLEWLDTTLATAQRDPSIDHTIVLGHLPIAYRDRVAIGVSSGLLNDTDEQGPLWQTLVEHEVDLYLPGEVHAISMQHSQGVLQVVTGTNIFQPSGDGAAGSIPFVVGGGVDSEENYLVIDSYADRLELRLEQIDTKIFGDRGMSFDPVNDEPYLNREARVLASVAEDGFRTVGTLSLDTSMSSPEVTEQTGLFESMFFDVAFDPLVTGRDGAYALDMGNGYGVVLDGYARVSASGSTGGDLQIRFETDVAGGISWRDRGPMSAGQTESDLARDFVFAEASAGASYLDVVIEGLPPGDYVFEAVLHEAGSSGEPEPVEVRVDAGEGFGEGVTVPMSMGNNPAAVSVASIDVDASGDVLMRIQNLEAGRPHLISGLRVLPMP